MAFSVSEIVTAYAPTSITAVWFENVTLSCKASGRPAPLVTWKRKDGEYLEGEWSLSKGIANLTFVASPYNRGTYSCEAWNNEITSTTETSLVVIHFTIIPPSLVTAPEGVWIQLDCQTNINTNITWRRTGGDLPNEHLLFKNGSLLLQNATTLHSGQYVCVINIATQKTLRGTQVIIGNLSCSHIKAGYPEAPSGNYTIDPDNLEGEDPFVVYCDMNGKNGTGVTIIGHDNEGRSHVTGCNTSGCFSRNVTYTATTLTQLTNLIRVSTHCEQFVMFECNGSVAFIEEKASWWLSRDQKSMYYWGGAAPGSAKCACGMTNTCDGGGWCNCKSDGAKGRRNDSGLLTDKSSLPVTQLRLGTVNIGSYYTLDKIKCYGWTTISGNFFFNPQTFKEGVKWIAHRSFLPRI